MADERYPSFTQIEISHPHRAIQSLVWRGDELVDWVSGGRAFLLDGTIRDRAVGYSYRFDAAAGSPSGRDAVIYERLGTKGLILRNGEIIRELNRSFYHAHVYEYPVCLFNLSNGREVVAHCPEAYCNVVIEDAGTGERLSVPETGDRRSFFHSRLAASPDGRLLMTAGWIWHPFDAALVWELHSRPDGSIEFHDADKGYLGKADVASAAFAGNGHMLVSTASGADHFDDDEEAIASDLAPMMLGRWDFAAHRWEHHVTASDEVGTLMAVGKCYAVGFYDCPKLFDLKTGRVVCRWPDLKTGRQLSSIIHHLKAENLPPPMALDPLGRRFAVAQGKQITVIQFE